MKPYNEGFASGSSVRIRDREFLERFRQEWKHHNPLKTEQLEYASHLATIEDIGFYHGGDPLYKLTGLPGVWHEDCLTAA